MGRQLLIPILVVLVGTAWFLNVLGVLPAVNWVWTIGLAATGILALLLGGINRLTFVMGPFLLVASVFSILRQTGRISSDTEVPILTIILGALWLAGTLLRLPVPEALRSENETKR